jgi:hypothetical protein
MADPNRGTARAAGTAHGASDMAGHPDVAEMRERHTRVVARTGNERAIGVDGMLILTGLYAAISPWVLHFNGTHPDLTVSNLLVGLTLAAIGLGLALIPDRMQGLPMTGVALGVWLIISPWVVTLGHAAFGSVIWSNVFTGAVACFLGLLAAGIAMLGFMRNRKSRT